MTASRTPARKPSSPASRDPYGVALRRPLLAPILAAVGLGIVTLLTVALFTGSIPFLPTGGGTTTGGGGVVSRPPGATPKPNVVETNKEVEFPGSLVYVKAGNLWIQTGSDAKQLTKTGADADPAWSPDGRWIYFVTHKSKRGLYQQEGRPAYYDLEYPILMQIRPDGTGREELLSGLIDYPGKQEWQAFILDPDPAPDGKTIALVSDLPDPTDSNVVVQSFDLKTGKLTPVPVPENPPLGHQDPAYSPDGKTLLYVMNARDGARGAPAIWRWLPAKKRFGAVSGPGYVDPAWSPDGRLIAATRTDGFGTDVVILDAKTGAEIEGVTDDGRSWAPTWSPRGDQLVYMHLEGLAVDLRIVELTGTGSKVVVAKIDPLTDFAGLDGASRATWFVPASELPAASPSAAASPPVVASPSAVESPAASAAP
jgi:Tol biopolymer transport system component